MILNPADKLSKETQKITGLLLFLSHQTSLKVIPIGNHSVVWKQLYPRVPQMLQQIQSKKTPGKGGENKRVTIIQ